MANVLGIIAEYNPFHNGHLYHLQKSKKMTNSESNIVFKPLPSDDPIKRKPDITLAKKYLDWEPVVSFEEGIGNTIAYFDKKLRNNL